VGSVGWGVRGGRRRRWGLSVGGGWRRGGEGAGRIHDQARGTRMSDRVVVAGRGRGLGMGSEGATPNHATDGVGG